MYKSRYSCRCYRRLIVDAIVATTNGTSTAAALQRCLVFLAPSTATTALDERKPGGTSRAVEQSVS